MIGDLVDFIEAGTKRKGIMVECPVCNTEFPTRINRQRTCCSPECRSKLREEKVEVKCAYCSNLILKRPSALGNSRSGLHFCNRKCKEAAQSLEGGIKEIQPSHYGNSNGINSYRDIAFKIKDKICEKCGYEKYPQILQVHHVDRDRNNNSIENLQVLCPNCHAIEHFISSTGLWKKTK